MEVARVTETRSGAFMVGEDGCEFGPRERLLGTGDGLA